MRAVSLVRLLQDLDQLIYPGYILESDQHDTCVADQSARAGPVRHAGDKPRGSVSAAAARTEAELHAEFDIVGPERSRKTDQPGDIIDDRLQTDDPAQPLAADRRRAAQIAALLDKRLRPRDSRRRAALVDATNGRRRTGEQSVEMRLQAGMDRRVELYQKSQP